MKPLLLCAVAVAGLIVLVARGKLSSFIALSLASLFVGLCAGLQPVEVLQAFSAGLGNVLGSIAMIIALGAIMGKLLAESGGAAQIAETFLRTCGQRGLPWTMTAIGFVIGLPVFFAVGLVLLVPIVLTLARRNSTPLLRLALPLVAGLSVAHGFVPPHPGPIAAVAILKADVGKTIFYALLIGVPTAVVAGPLLVAWLGRNEPVQPGNLALDPGSGAAARSAPGFALALFTILLPVLLMLFGTSADLTLAKDSSLRRWADLLGHPVFAMLAATLFSFWSLGTRYGLDRHQLLRFSEQSLAPVAQILLVVGAGGGFSQVLIQSGVARALAQLAAQLPISPLLLGWLLAALIRVATGSATVAITAASGLMAPIAEASAGLNRELLIMAMGAGSVILSHVNDGGFWLVKEYFNLGVTQTLKTWTVLETVISVAALGFTLLLNVLIV